MSFWDSFGRKAKEAAQEVAKKSGELVEVTRLNISISNEEDKVRKLYLEMGKKIYDTYRGSQPVDNEFEEICKKIDNIMENIESMKQKILEIKNIKLCVNCGKELEQDAAFCAKCGTKQPEQTSYRPEGEEDIAVNVCPSCNEALDVEADFCTKCGARIDE
jgi:ribosomal protein L40E